MIPIADNPAVTAPRKALTPRQRDALMSIAFFRNHSPQGAGWQIGPKRYDRSVIDALERMELIRKRAYAAGIDTTTAGKLVVDKLRATTK